MTRFISQVQRGYTPNVHDYPSLYEWSIREPQKFWAAVWQFCEIQSSHRWDTVLEHGDKMPGAVWFKGSRLNFAENLLRRRGDKIALVFRGEDGSRMLVSYRQLHDQVARLSLALTEIGVKPRDRVAGFLPNIPQTVMAMLATASVGAVWSSCSPDFGLNGALDRFAQIQPKVLFAADGYRHNGKINDSLERTEKLASRLPSTERIVVIPFIEQQPDISGIPNAVLWDDFIEPTRSSAIDFQQLPFDHPVYILYSSGTTGMPKCIVHSAGGTLIQHLKELVLHTDLKSEDTIFYFTTCGWMMWNWLVSSLATGATMVLYDGSPFYPKPKHLFDLAQQEGITIFGTSAKFLSAAEKAGVRPTKSHNLSELKTILSTGSPLAPESFDYVYRDIKADVQLASISGGTDIISCFALGNPIGAVYRGELQSRGLGMNVTIFDDQGHPVKGQKGELVCTAPFPSMPVGFWNDPDGEKYQRAYFKTFPGIWAHGDYAELTERGGVIIFGRSDAVLNPGGVRIGTAEIYRAVEKLPEVLESIAVTQEWKGDARVVLFVKLREGMVMEEALSNTIKNTIRQNASPRHVPAKVLQVADIPRTLNGKITELAVRDVIHNRVVKNVDALANPEALELYRDLPELRTD